MLLNRIKLFAIAIVALPMIAMAIFNTDKVRAVSEAKHAVSLTNDEAAASYKSKCAACHTAKAEKFFDTTKKDEVHVEAILKGRKAAKPPHMPEYGSKGVTTEQAQALVGFMRQLRDVNAPKDAKPTGEKAEARQETEQKSREAIIATYKSKCAACHSAKADKFFDTTMKESEMVQIILKGEKKEKPPHMPEFASKGVTEKDAKALAAYMIELRTPGK